MSKPNPEQAGDRDVIKTPALETSNPVEQHRNHTDRLDQQVIDPASNPEQLVCGVPSESKENSEISQALATCAQKLHIDTIQRHIFLCADQTKPKCCQKEVGIKAWDYLKRRISELELGVKVFRTKANCLRVCDRGPIMVIYPDRVWYHSATEAAIERILQEHVIKGKVVKELAFVSPTEIASEIPSDPPDPPEQLQPLELT
jgi:(2Fe-2S) ferredoxin